jgi:hypothetical protein
MLSLDKRLNTNPHKLQNICLDYYYLITFCKNDLEDLQVLQKNDSMHAEQIQQVLFQQIKQALPPHISMADAVAELLEISNDSAYRRIRGEKSISLLELQKLAVHYKISIDQLLHLQTDAFIFNGRIANASDFNFENWLHTCVQHLGIIQSFQPNHLGYLAKEVPFFYYFLFPEIAAFKSFFFMKSILYYENYKNARFSVKDDYSHYGELWKKISTAFVSIPSTEIWSIENITSTLHQIEFYRVTGVLQSDEDAIALLTRLLDVVQHIERQAEYGVKLAYGQDPSTSKATYKLFVNELIMGDNMQIIQLGDKYVTYINHSVINFITTQNPAFNDYMRKTFDNIAQKSTLISAVNEKDRVMFFNRLRAKINSAIKKVTEDT